MGRKHKHRPASSRATGAAAASGGGGAGAAPRAAVNALRLHPPTSASSPVLTPWTPRIVALPASRDEADAGSAFETFLALPLGRLAPLCGCFPSAEARVLRLLSRAAEAHVASTPFSDQSTPVRDLAKWRACFPAATGLKLSSTVRWTPAALPYLSSISSLDASGVTSQAFLDALRASPLFSSLSHAHLTDTPNDFLVELLTDDGAPPPMVAAAHAALRSQHTVGLTRVQLDALVASLGPALPVEVAYARLHLLSRMGVARNEDALVKWLVAGGTIEKAIAALRAFKAHAGAAGTAAAVLDRISGADAVYTQAVAHAGPTPALIAALEAHPRDATLSAAAVAVLERLPMHSPSTLGVMLACGAPRALLAVIAANTREHSTGDDMTGVIAGTHLLRKLLEKSLDRVAPATLAVPRALDTLLGALSVYARSRVAHTCIIILQNLSCSPGNEVGAAVRSAAGARAVVADLTAAAAAAATESTPNLQHLDDALRCGVSLLRHALFPIFAAPEGGHGIDVAHLLAAGATQALLDALAACPATTQRAAEALQCLLVAAPDAEALVGSQPIVPAMVAAMARSEAREGAATCAAMLRACYIKAKAVATPQLVQPHVLDVIAAVLTHAVVTRETAPVLRLVCNLATEAPAAVAIAASGALATVLGAADADGDDEAVKFACNALDACAAVNDEAAVAAVAASGAVAAVVRAAARSSAPLEVACAATMTLVNLSSSQAAGIVAAGGTGVLLQVAAVYRQQYTPLLSLALVCASSLATSVRGCLAPHVGQVAEVVSELLLAESAGASMAPLCALSLTTTLLKCGAPPEEIVGALLAVQPAFEAAVGTAVARFKEATGATLVLVEATAESGEVHGPSDDALDEGASSCAAVRAAAEGEGEGDEAGEVAYAPRFLAHAGALRAAVADYAGEHPEAAAALAGWGEVAAAAPAAAAVPAL